MTDRLLPALSAKIAEQLGQEGWALVQDAADPGTIHFAYPRAVEGELAYVRPEVRIELGGRNDDWPAEDRTVTPYIAEALPQIVPAAVAVRALG